MNLTRSILRFTFWTQLRWCATLIFRLDKRFSAPYTKNMYSWILTRITFRWWTTYSCLIRKQIQTTTTNPFPHNSYITIEYRLPYHFVSLFILFFLPVYFLFSFGRPAHCNCYGVFYYFPCVLNAWTPYNIFSGF